MSAPLAAMIYDGRAGCDLLLANVAATLRHEGVRLAGVVQTNDTFDVLCACDMTLSDLATGENIRISQRLGRYARGCRLDPDAMTRAVGLAEAGLNRGADLLIVNKFGKIEAAGGGFRPLIAQAVAAGVPVLVGLSEANITAWDEFAGDMGSRLPPLDVAVFHWLHEANVLKRAIA